MNSPATQLHLDCIDMKNKHKTIAELRRNYQRGLYGKGRDEYVIFWVKHYERLI